MPDLDGISALPLLLKQKPDVVAIMVSTLTRRSAEISLRALALGAADYVPKPELAREAIGATGFQRELIGKVRTLGRRRVITHRAPRGLGARSGHMPQRGLASRGPAPLPSQFIPPEASIRPCGFGPSLRPCHAPS